MASTTEYVEYDYLAPEDHLLDVDGEKVDPFRLSGAELRDLVAHRTDSGRISATAKKAALELARRKANKQAKRAAGA